MDDSYGVWGAELRHERAGEHLAYIDLAVQAFRSDNPYPIRPYEDLDALPRDWVELMTTKSPEPGYGGFEITREIRLSPRLGIRVGEAIYNLRAVLDHLIFSLAWHDGGTRPEGAHERALQFPIEDRRSKFHRRRNSMLKGLTDEHVALVQRYQPSYGCDWTGLLRDLSNGDKHRQIMGLAGSFNTYEGEYFTSLSEIPEAVRERARLASPGQMDVGLYATLDVTLMDGRPLTQTLQELHAEVGKLLARFRREFVYPPAD